MAAPAPQATSSTPYTPVLTDLWRLVRAPFTPKAVFEEQQETPRFWTPWIIVSLVFAVLQILQRPFQDRIRVLILQHMGQPVPAASIGLGRTLMGVVLGALTVLILAALAGGIYYVVLLIFGGQTTFKKMLVVVIYGWPIAILQQVLTVIVLTSRGAGSIQSVWDVQVSFGLDLLLPSDAATGAFLRLFLAGIGPLAIWQLIISAVGLKTLGKVSTGAAWSAALISFAILLVALASLGAFGINAALKAMGG